MTLHFAYFPCMGNPFHFRTIRIFVGILSTLIFIVSFSSCQTGADKKDHQDVPYTLQTFPDAYADRVIEVIDTNKDEQISREEWIRAGGTHESFTRIDANNDATLTRSELISIGSHTKVFDTTRQYVDFNRDNQMTPREFRTASGIQLIRATF